MNLIKCPNGHFYDASKFQQCPHCVGVQNNDLTVPVNPQSDQETVAVDAGQDAKTVAIEQEPVTVAPGPITPPAPQAPPAGIPPFTPPTELNIPSLTGGVRPAADSKAADYDDDVETIGIYGANAPDKKEAEEERNAHKKRLDPVVGWLVVVNGEERGRSVQLKAGRNFIGRSSSNDIALAGDKKISREKHAIIVFEPRSQTFLVQPGTSKQLFYVNDQVILDTKVINAYDIINIGDTNLVFIPFCGESFSWDTEEED